MPFDGLSQTLRFDNWIQYRQVCNYIHAAKNLGGFRQTIRTAISTYCCIKFDLPSSKC